MESIEINPEESVESNERNRFTVGPKRQTGVSGP